MNDELLKVLITSAVTLVGSWLLFRGGKRTADVSKAASEHATHVDAQESALAAWQAMVDPLMKRVDWLERRMEEADAKHELERRDMQDQVTRLTERVDFQAEQIKHWKRLAKVIARWATTLRDQVLSLGGQVPATPEELLLIQALDNDDDVL